ncbi:MAG: DUF1338 domain-containing protein [Proteobacteria bacterium]|nr:DUF1338 domain-containing protein [Pseudomonadota bacterium]
MDSAAVLHQLLDALWTRYKSRVDYACQYQSMVEARGGKVQNDHIAFRTLNTQTGQQPAGVEALARIFTSLGYRQMEQYIFTDKKLASWHYEHPANPHNPKIFISQLEVEKLSPATAALIKETVANIPDLLSAQDLKLLADLKSGKNIGDTEGNALVGHLADFFSRPWKPPERATVEQVNKESQYAAWMLLHGNSVNHFTAYINYQQVKEWPDLEATVNALRQAGLPMKSEFEGERGSKLRQSSTQAWDEDCDVLESNGKPGKLRWSYAYYELAERGMVPGPHGTPVLFQGFLGEQATNLFEMTKRG